MKASDKPADAREGGLRRELRKIIFATEHLNRCDELHTGIGGCDCDRAERIALAFARRVVEEIERDARMEFDGEYGVTLKDIRAVLSDLEQGGKGGA